MSVAAQTLQSPNGCSEPVLGLGQPEIPSADWLIRLNLEKPITDIRSIGKWTRITKRCVDFAGAAVLLFLLFPLMCLVAILVRCTSKGPIFYRQVRTGLNQRRPSERRASQADVSEVGRRKSGIDRRTKAAFGKPFVLYKFRTMRIDAEKDGAQFAVKDDPRVTPIGRILRDCRLDELPQLWNVLRGEMSLVGPRPERPEFVEQLSQEIPDYLTRLGIKPGITGLAQVLNGYDNEVEGFRRKVALDLLYLQNCCFLNDVKILLRTIVVVLTGRGAL